MFEVLIGWNTLVQVWEAALRTEPGDQPFTRRHYPAIQDMPSAATPIWAVGVQDGFIVRRIFLD